MLSFLPLLTFTAREGANVCWAVAKIILGDLAAVKIRKMDISVKVLQVPFDSLIERRFRFALHATAFFQFPCDLDGKESVGS